MHRRQINNAAISPQSPGAVPTPDLSRHHGTPVGDAIDKALGRTADQTCPELHLLYGTDIKRVTTCIAVNDSLIELALDQGRVFSGGHSQAVCELEVELKQGLPIDEIRQLKRDAVDEIERTVAKYVKDNGNG